MTILQKLDSITITFLVFELGPNYTREMGPLEMGCRLRIDARANREPVNKSGNQTTLD